MTIHSRDVTLHVLENFRFVFVWFGLFMFVLPPPAVSCAYAESDSAGATFQSPHSTTRRPAAVSARCRVSTAARKSILNVARASSSAG